MKMMLHLDKGFQGNCQDDSKQLHFAEESEGGGSGQIPRKRYAVDLRSKDNTTKMLAASLFCHLWP